MNKVINILSNKCKDMNKLQGVKSDLYGETVDLVVNSNYSDDIKQKSLVELYRFIFYSNVQTSLDSRGDNSIKLSVLNEFYNSLKDDKLTDESIDEFKDFNNYMRNFIDNPIKFIDKTIEFYSEHPGAKF